MNWTGGRLQQGKQAKNTIAAKQKAFFAKARAKAQGGHQDIPVQLSILQDTDTDLAFAHREKLQVEYRFDHDKPQSHSNGALERLRDHCTSNLPSADWNPSSLLGGPVGTLRKTGNDTTEKLILLTFS